MLQRGNVAPVDLAQAAIGPGMALFSRYAGVVEADGSAMTVRMALGLINQVLDEILVEQEGDFDADTRFAVTWFEHRGTSEGPYGEAEVLARAKNTSVPGMEEAGVLHSRAGKVRLLNREEMSDGWDPAADWRVTVWEITQHLIKRLEEGGEEASAELLHRVGGLGEAARAGISPLHHLREKGLDPGGAVLQRPHRRLARDRSACRRYAGSGSAAGPGGLADGIDEQPADWAGARASGGWAWSIRRSDAQQAIRRGLAVGRQRARPGKREVRYVFPASHDDGVLARRVR
jgi:hypothetical protein